MQISQRLENEPTLTIGGVVEAENEPPKNRIALKDAEVSATLAPGKLTAIMGPSGAGKTSFVTESGLKGCHSCAGTAARRKLKLKVNNLNIKKRNSNNFQPKIKVGPCPPAHSIFTDPNFNIKISRSKQDKCEQ